GEAEEGVLHGTAALGTDRPDVAGPGDGERTVGLDEPWRAVVPLPIGVAHLPDAAVAPLLGGRAVEADVVEHAGGLREARFGDASPEAGGMQSHVSRRGGEQSNLHSAGEAGEVRGADLRPLGAVDRLVPGDG